ncbi:MAG: 50S ribosomal protein L1 [Candidatus Heimdallarchaeota archaeon]|nr:50S ribosomal protein L1 [Candidatus Heimdallarchaeota archaeon]MDH5644616.1 50S ribosomal protein L1 [Candidatus Heimdallarchaeota archaeon]
MSEQAIVDAVKQIKSTPKQRKFIESIDLAVALRDVDLKDPSKRFRLEVLLPHALNKTMNLCIIGDADVINRAKEAGVKYTLTEDEIDLMIRNPKEVKSYIKKIDYFLAIPQLMAVVGKSMGRFLGPAGKMPSVLPPNANIEDFVFRYSRIARVRVRQNPVVHCRVGTFNMEDEHIAANIRVVINEIENKLEQGSNNIKHYHIKTTMGSSVKLGV